MGNIFTAVDSSTFHLHLKTISFESLLIDKANFLLISLYCVEL